MAQEHNLVVHAPHLDQRHGRHGQRAPRLPASAEAPFLEFPYDPPEWGLDRRDYMMREPLRVDGGWIVLGEAPGMGYAPDEESLARTRTG